MAAPGEVVTIDQRVPGSVSVRTELLRDLNVVAASVLDDIWSQMRVGTPAYRRLTREQAQEVRDGMDATLAVFIDCLGHGRSLSAAEVRDLTALGANRARQDIPLDAVQHAMQVTLDRFATRLWAAADALDDPRGAVEARELGASLDALALAARGAISHGWVQGTRAHHLFDGKPQSPPRDSDGRSRAYLVDDSAAAEHGAATADALVVVALPRGERGEHGLTPALCELASLWPPSPRRVARRPAKLSEPCVHGVLVLTAARLVTEGLRASIEAVAARHSVLCVLGRSRGADVGATYDRMASCLGVAPDLAGGRRVVDFDDLAVYEPLAGTAPERAWLIVSDTLGDLLTRPTAYVEEMVGTVRALQEVRWVATEAAERLHVHPNTVRNRVKALARLTGRSFDDSSELERLTTAIRLLDMYPTLLSEKGG